MPKKKSTSSSAQEVNLAELKLALDNAEKQIKVAKQLLFGEIYKEKAQSMKSDGDIVEGVFDGVDMVGADGKRYSVPSNYASKSKLVSGDAMKLTTGSDGSRTFKQIGPVERKRIVGKLCEENGSYYVECENKIFQVLPASVTYYKANHGDRVALVVSKDGNCNWGAVDNVISQK